jgi:Fe-S cluster assembly ATP-binding protein
MVPLLSVEELYVEVEGKVVLNGIDLAVEEGQRVAIMGPNGSGKSTLVSTIMGKPGYAVKSGDIRISGASILSLDPDERARLGISLISQYQAEIPGLRVDDLVELALAARGLPVDGLQGRLSAEAASVELDTKLLERWVNVDLSGGERKKLETVLASIIPNRLIIGDEIDSGLDIDALRRVAQRIDEVSRENGTALLLITHYPRLLGEIPPDKVVVLSKGHIVDQGGTELATKLEQTGYGPYE